MVLTSGSGIVPNTVPINPTSVLIAQKILADRTKQDDLRRERQRQYQICMGAGVCPVCGHNLQNVEPYLQNLYTLEESSYLGRCTTCHVRFDPFIKEFVYAY